MRGRHWLTKASPSLPFPYVTCGTCGPSYWNEPFLRMFSCWLCCKSAHNIKRTTPITIPFCAPPYGHELCSCAVALSQNRIPPPSFLPPWHIAPRSAMSASPKAVLGEWVLATLGTAGFGRSLMVLLRNPVFKRCSLMHPTAICTDTSKQICWVAFLVFKFKIVATF